MLLEHDPRLFAIIRENEDIDPVGMGGRREVEDGADLQKVYTRAERFIWSSQVENRWEGMEEG